MSRSSLPRREADESFLDEVTTRVVLDDELRALVEETRTPRRDRSASFARSSVAIKPLPPSYVAVEVLQAVLHCATGYLGPAARPILGSELRRLGVTAQTLPWRLVPALINGIGRHLDTTHSAVEFSRSIQLAHQSLHAYWDIPTK